MDKRVKIKKVSTHEEIEFAQNCLQKADFIAFIGNFDETDLETLYICLYENKEMGVFTVNIDSNMKIKNASPILYMNKRYSKATYICFIEIFKYIFQEINVDRITIKVYSNNNKMLNLMRKKFFVYEGTFYYGLKSQNEYIHVKNYSILKNEFERIYRELYI